MTEGHKVGPQTTANSGGDTAHTAVLVHIEDAQRRRAWRTALQSHGVRVLLSAREAEAAKCLGDPQLALVVAVDTPAMRATVQTLRPALRVHWLDAEPALDQARMQEARHRLMEPTG